jgi:hypothetical protein
MFRKRLPGDGKSRWFAAVLVAIVAFVCSTVASATVMVYADLERLVELSDVIVQGRVVDQNTFYDEETDEIATVTTFEVDRAFHGKVQSGEKVKFRQWGGEYKDRIAGIPGDAHFAPYEESVIFLADGKGEYAGMRYLVALGQSKYTVVRNDGGEPFVIRNLSDLAFLDRDTQQVSPRRNEQRGLKSFTAELQTLVAGIKGGGQ